MSRMHQICSCQSRHEVQPLSSDFKWDYSTLSEPYEHTCKRIADFLKHEFLYDTAERKENFTRLLAQLFSQLDNLFVLCPHNKRTELTELGDDILGMKFEDLRKKAQYHNIHDKSINLRLTLNSNCEDMYLHFRRAIQEANATDNEKALKENLRLASEYLNIHLAHLSDEKREGLISEGDHQYGGPVHAMFEKLYHRNPDDSPRSFSWSWRSLLPPIALATSIITAVGVVLIPYFFETPAIEPEPLPPLTVWETLGNTVFGVLNGESSFYDAIVAPILG